MGTAGVGSLAAWRYWPGQGLLNPCLRPILPRELAEHELVQAAWQGLEPNKVWDCHVHLLGVGHNDAGNWVNPDMRSPWHPIKYTQFLFYQNAACVSGARDMDHAFVDRLQALHRGLAPGARLMLLAFDYRYSETGEKIPALSAYHTPNEYAAKVARAHPGGFEWIASIHPYRRDCVAALEQSVAGGARAVKWLPPAMGMDPASPLCDRFYQALARLDVPLLVHGGDEKAVEGEEDQRYGNPLRLRRPLEHGVRTIVCHCASLGANRDTDQGPNGPLRPNFELFARMMDEPAHEEHLFGDISAMTQINRVGKPLQTVIRRGDWQHRLVNGSDYPLPGIMPLFSTHQLARHGFITPAQAKVIGPIQRYNPLLFDLVLKRTLRVDGNRFANGVFETARFFST